MEDKPTDSLVETALRRYELELLQRREWLRREIIAVDNDLNWCTNHIIEIVKQRDSGGAQQPE